MSKINWDEIDWNLRNFEIMELTGRGSAAVSLNRRKLGKKGEFRRGQIRVPGSSKKAKLDWEKVNWARNDSQIAEMYGVTHQAVNSIRKRREQFYENQQNLLADGMETD